MLFNDEEISDLVYCRKIAELMNAAYPNKTREIITSNGKKVKFDYISIFIELKKIIYRIEGLLRNIFGKDLHDEKVRFVKNYFDSITITSSNYEESGYSTHIYLKDLIWNFYKYVSDFLGNKILFKDYENDEVSLEIDFIITELHNMNQSYGGNNSDKNDKFYDRVVLLEEKFKRLSEEVNQNSIYIKKTVDGFLLTQEKDFKKQLNDLMEGLRSSLGDIHTKYEAEIKGKVEGLNILVNQTDQDFQSTFNDYNQLKGLVNIKGEMLITDHYKKRAFWERVTYWAMTVATFIIIILSICLALNGLNEYKGKADVPVTTLIEKYKDQPIEKIEKIYSAAQKNALIYLVLRLIFSVLLFSSIIYTSRVAYRSYVHMRHSENMMLKLATLRPFINQLEEEDRNQIHKDLIPDYFGKDAGMVDSTNEKFKDLPANVSAVAMKAIEQISGSGSNSNTGKNDKKSESETG